MAFIDSLYSSKTWLNNITLGGISRNSIVGIFYVKNILDTGTIMYDKTKNYQYVTTATSSNNIEPIYLKFDEPFDTSTVLNTINVSDGSGGIEFYNYIKPLKSAPSSTLVNYGAYETFKFASILSTKVNDIKLKLNGYKPYRYLSKSITDPSQPNGWVYYDEDKSYTWSYSSSASSDYIYATNSWGGNNYLAKDIEDNFDIFNFECYYESLSVGSYVYVYLLKTDLENNVTSVDFSQPLLLLNSTGTYSKTSQPATNSDGSKNTLLFIANEDNGSLSKITNINIYGTYHDVNNSLTPTLNYDNILDYNLYNDASYLYTSSENGVTYSVETKVGNGTFKKGIWENGIWNSGWRNDTEVRDFDDVYVAIATSDASWKIEIRGTTQSAMNFKAGDVVSVGNIIAIDINDNRKILKDYYKIEDSGISDTTPQYGWVRINLDTIFPYRRIEKDSTNHKIKITKNVWLSGGFLNGYFSGVWNNGLFKGFPLITEMYDTHWIDGFFNGGHFNSNYSTEYDIKTIGPRENCSNGFMNFTTTAPTTLVQGDYILISLLVSVSDFIGNIYNGTAKILNVEKVVSNTGSYDIITVDKKSNGKPTVTNSPERPSLGKMIRYTSTGLIQNLKFYDNNRSKLKSSDSGYSPAVFSFNSWMDVNYDNTRSVTLGRDFRTYESLTGNSINRNNLFGYPTYDILSSSSRFRNANTLNAQTYKLGTKYKVYSNFINEFSKFNEPFNPNIPNGLVNFNEAGWVFSYNSTYSVSTGTVSNIYFNRTESLISLGNTYSQAFIDAGVTGDELYITAINDGGILNNNNILLNKFRYSVAEFDVITYSVPSYDYLYQNPDSTIVDFPILNFSNLNYDISITNDNLTKTYNKMTYLPINENINHLLTKNTFRLDSIENTSPDKWGGFASNQITKKYEYFYNKTDMMMNIVGNGLMGVSQSMVILDNINMYEVDMIPFFKYYDEKNIYKGIQIPSQGISPEIDYLDSDFVFIDNITISLDTIENSIIETDLNVCNNVSIDEITTVVKITSINLISTAPTSYTFINAVTGTEPGSATCSTTFTSLQWIIPPGLTITNENTLYPTINNLSINPGSYLIKVIVGNNGQTSLSECVITVTIDADFLSNDWDDGDFLTENSI